MYTFDSRIRYSESDSEGKLTLSSLLNYFQDCSTFHSEDIGMTRKCLEEQHLVWVLCSWQIVVERYPKIGEFVKVGTAPYEFRGFLGSRNFAMMTPKGEYLAKANSLWSLIDTRTGKPCIPPKGLIDGFTIEEKLPMEYAPRKIIIPKGGEKKEAITVKKHHLDTNYHVNNGQYVTMAMEFLPENFFITQMRAEYKKQAFLEDILYPYAINEQGKWVVVLTDEKDNVYVSVEFTGYEK